MLLLWSVLQSLHLRSHNSSPAAPKACTYPLLLGLSQINPSPSATLIPSPGTLLTANSPGNPQLHAPSPQSFVPTPSPQGLGLHMPSPAASFISPGRSQSLVLDTCYTLSLSSLFFCTPAIPFISPGRSQSLVRLSCPSSVQVGHSLLCCTPVTPLVYPGRWQSLLLYTCHILHQSR